jgi:hypothetical protein
MRHRFVTRAEKEAETERERRRKKEVFSTLPVLYLQSIIIHAVAFRPPIISSNLSSRRPIILRESVIPAVDLFALRILIRDPPETVRERTVSAKHALLIRPDNSSIFYGALYSE